MTATLQAKLVHVALFTPKLTTYVTCEGVDAVLYKGNVLCEVCQATHTIVLYDGWRVSRKSVQHVYSVLSDHHIELDIDNIRIDEVVDSFGDRWNVIVHKRYPLVANITK